MKQLKISSKQITTRESAALDKYLNDIGQVELLTPERETELAIEIKKGSEEAFSELVNANLRFVVSVAKQYQNQGLSLGDLINEGNLGLMKAAKRFDEEKGFKFISYAVWWVRQSILQALAEQARIVRLPLNRIGQNNKISKVYAQLEQVYEREPTADEVAAELGISTLDVIDARKSVNEPTLSLDKSFQQGEDGRLQDTIPNDDERPDSSMVNISLRSELESYMSTVLNEREEQVIREYFGVGAKTQRTLEEIGSDMGLTRERVRQVKEKSLEKLRAKCTDMWKNKFSE